MGNILQSVEIFKNENCKSDNIPNNIVLDLTSNIATIKNYLKDRLNNVEYITKYDIGSYIEEYVLYITEYYNINIRFLDNSSIFAVELFNKFDNDNIYFNTSSGTIKINDFINLVKLSGEKSKHIEFGDRILMGYLLTHFDNLDIVMYIDKVDDLYFYIYLK